MKTKLSILVCTCASIVLSSSAHSTELAKINNTVITAESFNKRYQENMKFFQFRVPSKKEVLDDLIKRELAVQEAKSQGLDKDPEIQDRINSVLFQSLVERKLGKDVEKIHISDDDAKSYYEKYPEIRTSHIFVTLPGNASSEEVKTATEKMKSIQKALKDESMSFAEVAQKFSEGISAPMGGDIDFQTRDRLDTKYYDEALKLRSPGKVSDIVRTPTGLYIIKLTSIHSWDETDKPKIKRIVFEEKRQKLFEQFMDQLKKKAKITVNEALLIK